VEEFKDRRLLLFLLAVNTVNFYDRQLLGAVTEPIRREWLLSDLQIGFLSTAFTLLYAGAGIPLGRMADTRSGKTVLQLGLLVWSLLTGLCSFAWNYWSLFLLRIGVGIGEACCAPTAISIIGKRFPVTGRSAATSLFMMGLPLGSALSYSLGGYLSHEYGWRWAFLTAGLAGILLAVIGRYGIEFAEERKTTVPQHEREKQRSGFPLLLSILRVPGFFWIILSGALHNFNLYAVSAFLPSFLVRYHRMDIANAGFTSGIAYALLGGIGMILGGFMGDRFRPGKHLPRNRLMLVFLTMIPTTPLCFLALSYPQGDVVPFALAFGAAAMLMYVYYPVTYAAIQDVSPKESQATAMSIYLAVMYFLGASLGPSVFGGLSDYFQKRIGSQSGLAIDRNWVEGEGLRQAMFLIPVLTMAVALTSLIAANRVRKN